MATHVLHRWRQANAAVLGDHDVSAEFKYKWDSVRYPGTDPMGGVKLRARDEIAAGIPELARYADEPKLQLLAAICRVLQRDHGTKPFPLSWNVPVPLLEVPDNYAVGNMINQLIADRILQRVDKPRRTKAAWRATTYRYLPAVANTASTPLDLPAELEPCRKHLEAWIAAKRETGHYGEHNIRALLLECRDYGPKITRIAIRKALAGGWKNLNWDVASQIADDEQPYERLN